jgi:deaminated glutathione amidase
MRAAAIQLNATDDVARNLDTARRLVDAAIADGATLILLPEKWTVLGSPQQLRSGAQPLDGPAITWAQETAAAHGVDIVAGSFSERVEGSERLRNTSVHVGPDGEIRAVYRKVHMFDVEVDGTQYRESDTEQPGDELVVSAAADGTPLGMSVCYDLRFPELYRELAVAGARILLVPSAFTLATTRDHWEVLLRARAIENQSFVVAANQIGRDGAGNRTGGRSMIVDPWGLVLASAPDEQTSISANLDLEGLQRIRNRIPSLASRRPEVYGNGVDAR